MRAEFTLSGVEGSLLELVREESVCGMCDWMWDWGVLVGGFVASDGADVAALVIDVNLSGGWIG
jgi:hypothetical protein